MSINRRPAVATGLAAGLAVILVAGCNDGPRTATVSGVVRVGGKEAEKGSLAFVPVNGKGQPTGCDIGPDGKYTAQVQYGTMKVEIRVPKKVGTKDLYGKGGPTRDVYDEVLPDKYHNNTELRLEVAGPVEKNWDLQPK